MTWKEMLEKERRWVKRVLIVDFYHCIRLTKNPKHRIEDTAKYFNISKGAVSESILLAAQIKTNPQLEHNSRNTALRIIRNGTKKQPSMEQSQTQL